MYLWSDTNRIFMKMSISERSNQLSLTQRIKPPQFVSPWLGAKVPPRAEPKKKGEAKTEPEKAWQNS